MAVAGVDANRLPGTCAGGAGEVTPVGDQTRMAFATGGRSAGNEQQLDFMVGVACLPPLGDGPGLDTGRRRPGAFVQRAAA